MEVPRESDELLRSSGISPSSFEFDWNRKEEPKGASNTEDSRGWRATRLCAAASSISRPLSLTRLLMD